MLPYNSPKKFSQNFKINVIYLLFDHVLIKHLRFSKLKTGIILHKFMSRISANKFTDEILVAKSLNISDY